MKKLNPPGEVVLDNDEKITGKVIIDASGIVCIVGKQIGVETSLKPEDIGVCIQSRVQSHFDSNTAYFRFHEPYAPFGYAWVFPVNDKEANIGLGVYGRQNLDLKKLLTEYIDLITNGNCKITGEGKIRVLNLFIQFQDKYHCLKSRMMEILSTHPNLVKRIKHLDTLSTIQ